MRPDEDPRLRIMMRRLGDARGIAKMRGIPLADAFELLQPKRSESSGRDPRTAYADLVGRKIASAAHEARGLRWTLTLDDGREVRLRFMSEIMRRRVMEPVARDFLAAQLSKAKIASLRYEDADKVSGPYWTMKLDDGSDAEACVRFEDDLQ